MSCLNSAISYTFSFPTPEFLYNTSSFSVTAGVLTKISGKNCFSFSITTFFSINNTNTLHSNEAGIAVLMDGISIFTISSNKKDLEAVAQYKINMIRAKNRNLIWRLAKTRFAFSSAHSASPSKADVMWFKSMKLLVLLISFWSGVSTLMHMLNS